AVSRTINGELAYVNSPTLPMKESRVDNRDIIGCMVWEINRVTIEQRSSIESLRSRRLRNSNVCPELSVTSFSPAGLLDACISLRGENYLASSGIRASRLGMPTN